MLMNESLLFFFSSLTLHAFKSHGRPCGDVAVEISLCPKMKMDYILTTDILTTEVSQKHPGDWTPFLPPYLGAHVERV